MRPGTVGRIESDFSIIKIKFILGHKTGGGIRPVLTLRITCMGTEIIGLIFRQTLYEGKLGKLGLNILEIRKFLNRPHARLC